jgi:hypothetical protein
MWPYVVTYKLIAVSAELTVGAGKVEGKSGVFYPLGLLGKKNHNLRDKEIYKTEILSSKIESGETLRGENC